MPRQQAAAAQAAVANAALCTPRDLDGGDGPMYDQYGRVDLDPKQLQEVAGQKKGILRRLLTKFKRKLTSGSGGAGAGGRTVMGTKPPPSPKPPRSPHKRSPAAVRSTAVVRAAAGGAAAVASVGDSSNGSGGGSASAPRCQSSHLASLPPWKQPNSGSNAHNTSASAGGSGSGAATGAAASGITTPAHAGPTAAATSTPLSGSNGASSSQPTPRTGTAGGGGGTGRTLEGRGGGLGYVTPTSPGAIAARPRPQFGAASGGGAAAANTRVSPAQTIYDGSGGQTDAVVRRRSQFRRMDGNGGDVATAAAAAAAAFRAQDDRGDMVTPVRAPPPLPPSYGALYGVGPPGGGGDGGGGDGGGVMDMAFSEVLLSEVPPPRRMQSSSLAAAPPPPAAVHGGGGGMLHPHPAAADTTGLGAPIPGHRARYTEEAGDSAVPYMEPDGAAAYRHRRRSRPPAGAEAAVAALAAAGDVVQYGRGGGGGDDANRAAASVAGGGLGTDEIAGELSSLIASLDEELAAVAAVKSKHTLRLKLVGSLLEMIPPPGSSPGAAGNAAALAAASGAAGGASAAAAAAAASSGSLGGRLTAERERLVSELTELAARDELLAYARREWGKVMTVMSGVRVSRRQAGPLQAILFSDTLARIRAFQKSQARRAAGRAGHGGAGGRTRGGCRPLSGMITSGGSYAQGYAPSASSHVGRLQAPPHLQTQSQSLALVPPQPLPGGAGPGGHRGGSRRGAQRSSSGAFAVAAPQHHHYHHHLQQHPQQHPQQHLTGPSGSHTAAYRQGGAPSGSGSGRGAASQSAVPPSGPQLMPSHHLALAPITEDDSCSPQKQPHMYQVGSYGEPHWAPEEQYGTGAGVPPLQLAGLGAGSHAHNVQPRQRRQQPRHGQYPPHPPHHQQHYRHRQEPYQGGVGAAPRGAYGGGSSALYGSAYGDGQYSDSGSSCSSGEMYRSIASLARNTVDGDDDFGEERLREVEEEEEEEVTVPQVPALPPRQRRHRQQQQLHEVPYQVRPESSREVAQEASRRRPDAGPEDDNDDAGSCSSSASLESAFIAKCLTDTRNSLDIRSRAADGTGAGGRGSAAAAASRASAAALAAAAASAAAAAASAGQSRLSRADRQLYSAAIHTLRANVLSTATGTSTLANVTMTTGGVTLPLNTAAGVAGSPAEPNAHHHVDGEYDEFGGGHNDVVYGNPERRDDGYFEVGPLAAARVNSGPDVTATPTSAITASGTNASSLGSVEDMLAAVAMLRGGGAAAAATTAAGGGRMA